MAAASEAAKNSMGWGRPSSDMNARDWVRMILELTIGDARRPLEVAIGETENRVRKRVESLEGISKLTGISHLMISLLASKSNVNKIDLELLIGLHADQRSQAFRCRDLFADA